MKLDSAGLQVLSPAECADLLASTPIGRVVFTDHALPAVQPVNFVLDGRNVVIRTTLGSKLAVAARNAVVAFETDEFDPAARTGWSVTAIGYARAVTDPAETERLARLPGAPWAQDGEDRFGSQFIVVPIQELSGRRISTHP
ncbi:pyridoxamine 5'-phosphate oxidase family protein [Thermopolyspora sp. NPDC052614]|uniref:pyridoxamine 5'-phosphate oxidase family protein n=1 Tax=Thermopolyspora sp. NPDC052614 TaxID=3155682 RepID=UPI00341FC89E